MHQPLVPGCLIIRFTITQNARHENPFHGVLCLERSERNGYKYEKFMGDANHICNSISVWFMDIFWYGSKGIYYVRRHISDLRDICYVNFSDYPQKSTNVMSCLVWKSDFKWNWAWNRYKISWSWRCQNKKRRPYKGKKRE